MNRMACLALVVFSWPALALAQTSVFLVRHAERADRAAGASAMMAADPDLSAAGRGRAASLATALKDAGITAIFATQFKRTQQTAEPLAAAVGVKVVTIPSKDTRALIAAIRAAHGNVLVVGHSDTVPDVIKGLGVETPLEIADREYDNLFVVTLNEKPTFLRLHYR